MKQAFLIIIAILSLNLNAQNKEKKPNFLFVLVDDQPHDAVGFSNRYPFLKDHFQKQKRAPPLLQEQQLYKNICL